MAEPTIEDYLHREPDVSAVVRRSRPMPWSPTVPSMTRPTPTTRRSGPARPASCCRGSTTSTPCSTGSCRSPSGSSAAPSTSPTTASTATSRPVGADKVAYHWEGEPGDTRTITYAELYDEVCRFANVLKGLGVERGDRVGDLHADDPGAAGGHAGLHPHRCRSLVHLRRVLTRLDHRPGQRRRGQGRRHRRRRVPRGAAAPLKAAVDEAVASTPSVTAVVVVQRTQR